MSRRDACPLADTDLEGINVSFLWPLFIPLSGVPAGRDDGSEAWLCGLASIYAFRFSHGCTKVGIVFIPFLPIMNRGTESLSNWPEVKQLERRNNRNQIRSVQQQSLWSEVLCATVPQSHLGDPTMHGPLCECPQVFPKRYHGFAGDVAFRRDVNILNYSVLNSGRALSSTVNVAANCPPGNSPTFFLSFFKDF